MKNVFKIGAGVLVALAGTVGAAFMVKKEEEKAELKIKATKVDDILEVINSNYKQHRYVATEPSAEGDVVDSYLTTSLYEEKLIGESQNIYIAEE